MGDSNSAFVFRSFISAGFECSTHRRRDGRRLDLIVATYHDERVVGDYRLLIERGIYTVRDGIRWHLVQRHPARYDWSSFLPMLHAARDAGLQVIWDLTHYGYPDWLDIWSKDFIDRYARYARSVARLVRGETDDVPFYVPINEISYWSWAGGSEGYMNPGATDSAPQLRQILIRAAIAGIEAVRDVDARARIVHAEPVTHMVPTSKDRKDDIEKANFFNNDQYRTWDIMSGLAEPELGGHPRYLDIIGVNFYAHNQATTDRIRVERADDRYKPFHRILSEVYNRYRCPIFVSETGMEGDGRVAWFRYICDEVILAMQLGVPVTGICLYPILSFPEWEDQRCCEYGLFHYQQDGERQIYQPLADEIRHQQWQFSPGQANEICHGY